MSGPRLECAENGVWYVHWTDGRRTKRVSTRQKNLQAAKSFFAAWLIEDRTADPETTRAFTIAQLWKVYFEKHVERPGAPASTARFTWNNLAPHFGDRLVSEIDQDLVDAYLAKRTSGAIGGRAVGSTIRRELITLRACINWCADPKRRMVAAGDIAPFDLPAEAAPRDRWLRHDETQKLLTAAASLRTDGRLHRVEVFLWLALETAGRKTALLELTWDRVDFETGVVHLNVPGARTTKKRRADVPMSAALRPVLERAHAERRNARVLEHGGDVWPTLQIVVERAGLAPGKRAPRRNGDKPKKTGISPHVLRHTAATQMARAGVPLWKIAKVLGNSLVMVEKVYAKHCPDDLREAVDRISNGRLEAAE